MRLIEQPALNARSFGGKVGVDEKVVRIQPLPSCVDKPDESVAVLRLNVLKINVKPQVSLFQHNRFNLVQNPILQGGVAEEQARPFPAEVAIFGDG